MADLTVEILTDREKWPDDRKLVLADGVETTVGAFRAAAMPKADFTKYAEGARRKEQQLTEQLTAAQQNLVVALQAREAEEAAKGKAAAPTTPTGEMTEQEYMADPVLGPMFRKIQKAAEALEAAQAENRQLRERVEGHEKIWTRSQFTAQIAEIQKADPELDVKDFLEFVQRQPTINTETQQVDLHGTYRGYSADRRIKAAEKAAEERGIEKGRKEASTPTIPFARRFTPVKPDGLPSTFQEVTEEQALADPDIQAAMSGGPSA